MIEETVVAASSAVQDAPETPNFEIPRSNTPEYAEWRKTGNLPANKQAKPKAADPAPADSLQRETTEDAADSAATTTQEQKRDKRRPDVEERFKKLTDEKNARISQLERELEEARRPSSTQADSSPAKPALPAPPQTYEEWKKTFKPREWVEKWSSEHPDATYEDATDAMTDFKADAREYFRTIEQQAAQRNQQFQSRVSDAESRYENFREIANNTAGAIIAANVPPVVQAMFHDSEVFEHLVYTIGKDKDALSSFLNTAKTNPGKAIRYIAEVELGIAAELAKGTGSARNDKGQFAATPPAPAKRGPESTPEPPIEIGSRGTGSMDEADRALSAAKSGDPKAFGAWKRAEDAKEIRRRKGM